MINIKEKIIYSDQSILSKKITEEVTLFSMGAGTEISEHTSTKRGFVYVIEGKGIFKLEKENIEMKEGIFIPLKENQVHSLKAIENTSFLLLLINLKI